MNNNIDLPYLKQIYYYFVENPEIYKLTDFEKTIEFFRSIHNGSRQDFYVDLDQIRGKLGHSDFVVFLKSSPPFSNTNVFLNWVLEVIK